VTAPGDLALLEAAAEHLSDEPGPEELAAGVLRLQRCSHCGYVRYPAAPCCPECLSREFEWREDAGLGSVWSYCVYHHAFDKAFEAALPYNVVLVELDAGPRLISNVLGVAPGELHVGMRVTALPREVRPGRFLLYFAPAGGDGPR
jgi:uncharacterized OB-fold protein